MVSDDPTGCWHGAMVGKDGDGVWERHFQMSFSWVATLNSRWRCIHSPLLEAGAIGVIPVLFFAWDVFSHWRRSRWSSPCLRGWCLSQRLEPWTTWTARPRLFFWGLRWGWISHQDIPRYMPHMIAVLIVLATIVRKPFRICAGVSDRTKLFWGKKLQTLVEGQFRYLYLDIFPALSPLLGVSATKPCDQLWKVEVVVLPILTPNTQNFRLHRFSVPKWTW